MKMGFTAGVVFGMVAGAATALTVSRPSNVDLLDELYVCRIDLAHASGLLAKYGIVEKEASK